MAFRLLLLAAIFSLASTAFAQRSPYRFDHWTTDNGLPHNSVLALRQTRDGYLWLATGDGLARFDSVRFRVFNKANTPGLTNAIFSAYALMEDRQGALWAGGRAGGLVRYFVGVIIEDSQRRLWYELKDRSGEAHCVNDGRLTVYRGLPPQSFVCYQDRQGRLWLSDRDGRLALWSSGQLSPLAGISTTVAFRVLEDSEGGFWVGTRDEGLRHLRARPITVLQRPGGIRFNFLNALLQDRGGAIWLGGVGLSRFKDGKFDHYRRPARRREI